MGFKKCSKKCKNRKRLNTRRRRVGGSNNGNAKANNGNGNAEPIFTKEELEVLIAEATEAGDDDTVKALREELAKLLKSHGGQLQNGGSAEFDQCRRLGVRGYAAEYGDPALSPGLYDRLIKGMKSGTKKWLQFKENQHYKSIRAKNPGKEKMVDSCIYRRKLARNRGSYNDPFFNL